MPVTPIPTIVKVDLDKKPTETYGVHNRWHPDIPAAAKVDVGTAVKLECWDWTGGQISNNDSADDIKYVDLTKIHYLSGPLHINGAEPGDVLEVEIQDVQPREDQPWGYSGVFAKENGGGFLDEYYPKAAKAIFDFEGIFCTSRHIPGTKWAGLIHPGIMGTAPSKEILETWNSREKELVDYHAAGSCHGCSGGCSGGRIVAQLPNEVNAFAGVLASKELQDEVAKTGARTIPGRPEHGGNCDIKNLSRGSKSYFPVHVDGAKFSVGDLHFSQGDGEISFCGAIEMAGVITLKFSILKGGMKDMDMKSPMYLPGPVEPHYGPNRYLTFEGFSVDDKGKQHFLDTTLAYRETCRRVIEYFRRFGYNDYQIYLLMTTAPIQGHIAGIVDIPNSCTTIGVPMDIFDFDVSPGCKIEKRDLGTCAFPSDE